MGKIEKGIKCSIVTCEKTAIRSLPASKIDLLGVKVKCEKRAYLCEAHYKDFKKKSKDNRQIEKWRWNA